MSRHNTAPSSHQVGSDHAALACQHALPPPELKHPSPTAFFFFCFVSKAFNPHDYKRPFQSKGSVASLGSPAESPAQPSQEGDA